MGRKSNLKIKIIFMIFNKKKPLEIIGLKVNMNKYELINLEQSTFVELVNN